MKRIYPLILLIITFLASCSSKNKEEAYCFSMVFEKSGGTPTVTMYCKTQNNDDNLNLSDNNFIFSAQSLIDAVLSADNSDYEIYFSSTKAVYFSPDITYAEMYEIMVYFLNHSKYQSSVSVYTPKDNKIKDVKDLKREAESVCKDEKISYTKQKDYTFLVKALRNMYR